MPPSEILCVGEMLWDSLPTGLFLGGAPFNVACHLRAAGLPVAIVSRVARDALGEEAVRRASGYGIATDLVQFDDDHPTGLVRVAVSPGGEPTFDIVQPAAWDALESNEQLVRRAAGARAIVFGTLAQRAARSRRTIRALLDGNALAVLDVNLRPPYDERAIVLESLALADVVKFDERELHRVADWIGAGGPLRTRTAAIGAEFGCRTICITLGAQGAALWHDGEWTAHPGFEVEVRDPVGAGDAFLGALLAGMLDGLDPEQLLRRANLIGAFVVSQPGAVPPDLAAVTASLDTEPAAVGHRGRARGR